MQISDTAEPSALHLLAFYAYNTLNVPPQKKRKKKKESIFTLRNDHFNRKYTIKAVSFTLFFLK